MLCSTAKAFEEDWQQVLDARKREEDEGKDKGSSGPPVLACSVEHEIIAPETDANCSEENIEHSTKSATSDNAVNTSSNIDGDRNHQQSLLSRRRQVNVSSTEPVSGVNLSHDLS